MDANAPANWLSEIIEHHRSDVSRFLPDFERRAERDAIVEAIKTHPTGAALASHRDLPEIVFQALQLANDRDREEVGDAMEVAASPAVHASWFIFTQLDIPHPDCGEQG